MTAVRPANLSPDELAQIRTMWEGDASIEAIAEATHRSKVTVRAALFHMVGETAYQARVLYKQRHMRHWTPDEEKRLVEMNAAGYDTADIAAALDRTYSSITSRLQLIAEEGRPHLKAAAAPKWMYFGPRFEDFSERAIRWSDSTLPPSAPIPKPNRLDRSLVGCGSAMAVR